MQLKIVLLIAIATIVVMFTGVSEQAAEQEYYLSERSEKYGNTISKYYSSDLIRSYGPVVFLPADVEAISVRSGFNVARTYFSTLNTTSRMGMIEYFDNDNSGYPYTTYPLLQKLDHTPYTIQLDDTNCISKLYWTPAHSFAHTSKIHVDYYYTIVYMTDLQRDSGVRGLVIELKNYKQHSRDRYVPSNSISLDSSTKGYVIALQIGKNEIWRATLPDSIYGQAPTSKSYTILNATTAVLFHTERAQQSEITTMVYKDNIARYGGMGYFKRFDGKEELEYSVTENQIVTGITFSSRKVQSLSVTTYNKNETKISPVFEPGVIVQDNRFVFGNVTDLTFSFVTKKSN